VDQPAVRFYSDPAERPVAKFIVPDWGDKVDSGIGLSYRPARLLAGGSVQQRYDGVNFIPPVRDYSMHLATAQDTHTLSYRQYIFSFLFFLYSMLVILPRRNCTVL
jgi:hypothetical protein